MSNAISTATNTGQLTGAPLSAEDQAIIDGVDDALAAGVTLKNWWNQTYPDGYAEKFELDRVFNRPASSFGFFDKVELRRGPLPVMGNFQEMFYDRPRTPTRFAVKAAEWMRDQIREYVLQYFMRVSSFRQPEVYV